MPERGRKARESEKDRDRFFVQKDRHPVFQRLSQGEDAPFRTMKDAWLLCAALGYRAGRRQPMTGGTQHVGFWHYLSPQEDIPLLQAIAIAETGDIAVLGSRDHVIGIAEEYANGGVDLIAELERPDREGALRSIAAALLSDLRTAIPRSRPPAETPSPSEAPSTRELLASGESKNVEFKATARWNIQKGDRDTKIEREVVDAICAFMNSEGGTLLIGVSDEHVPLGLQLDYKTFSKRQNKDGFENWLTDLLQNWIGKPAIANLSVQFEDIEGIEICRVEVNEAPSPVYLSEDPYFYVRLNNSTRKLNSREMTEYIRNHWSEN